MSAGVWRGTLGTCVSLVSRLLQQCYHVIVHYTTANGIKPFCESMCEKRQLNKIPNMNESFLNGQNTTYLMFNTIM